MSVGRVLAARVSLWSRRRKMDAFLRLARPTPDSSVVDVGVGDTGFDEEAGTGSTHNFFEALYPWPDRITAVGVTELDRFAAAFPQIRAVRADGRDLPFADGEFDVAFSNAVVEHVGGRDDQRAFVHELCRVASRVFVTTPNRWFPIEVHTLLPLVHWLPARERRRAFELLRRAPPDGTELLGPGELRELFPRPVRVLNRGLTLIAVG